MEGIIKQTFDFLWGYFTILGISGSCRLAWVGYSNDTNDL